MNNTIKNLIIQEIDQQIKELEFKMSQIILKMQSRCSHPADAMVELNYISNQDTESTSLPFRVCLLCGYAEKGWGLNYKNIYKL